MCSRGTLGYPFLVGENLCEVGTHGDKKDTPDKKLQKHHDRESDLGIHWVFLAKSVGKVVVNWGYALN